LNSQAKTIDDVLQVLDSIIEDSVNENNRLGIFAYIYRRTTAQIKQAILDKKFEDNDRMQKLDVAFANIYLNAYKNFGLNETISKSWMEAFKSKNEKLTTIQHIILGMNAHINLDLGIAASGIMPPDKIEDLKNDFMLVNQILKDLINEMQLRVSRVSRTMILLDWIGQNEDEKIINFSIVKAREQAWDFANSLSTLHDDERENKIKSVDDFVSDLANIIKRAPGILTRIIMKIISMFEEQDVKKIITLLEEN
jgi:Family of unknown function (DUF5995)